MTAVTGLSVLYYKSPPYKKTAPHHRCGRTLSISRLLLKANALKYFTDLASHQPLQNRTIPLTFRNANICMCRYAFTSALNLPPLSKVRCCRPIKFGRRPEGLPHHHPSLCTNPSKTALSHSLFVMPTSVCADMLSHPHYPSPRTTTLASLVKGRWIDGTTQTFVLLRPACDMLTIFIL